MCERDDLMRFIVENPDDDGARRAFSDWLEENGDPDWAELIRVQIKVADEGECFLSDPGPRLRALEEACGNRLRARLPDFAGVNYQLVRGFPIAVANNPAAAIPFVLFPHRDGITGLRLLRLPGLRLLAGRLRMRSIRHLSLAGCRLNAGYAGQALAQSPNLTGLVRLDLSRTNATGVLVLAVARNPALAGLRALDLAGNRGLSLPDLPGKLLTALPALTDLDLSRTKPSPEVLWAWAADPVLSHLSCLRLNRNRLGDFGAADLAAIPHLAGLGRLELRENGITAAGAEALARSPYLQALQVLDLQHNRIKPAAADALRAQFGPGVDVRLST